MVRDSDGYCMLTGCVCDILLGCQACDVYREYKKEKRYGCDEEST